MFTVFQLDKPLETETPFGALTSTHGKRYVEHIDPTDSLPIVVVTIFGVLDSGGKFLPCPFVQPAIESLDQKGYATLLNQNAGDFLVSEIPAAIAARAAEIQAEIDAKKNPPAEVAPPAEPSM